MIGDVFKKNLVRYYKNYFLEFKDFVRNSYLNMVHDKKEFRKYFSIEKFPNIEWKNLELTAESAELQFFKPLILENVPIFENNLQINWFDVFSNVRKNCLNFSKYLREREDSLTKFNNLFKYVYIPIIYLLLIVSSILLICKYSIFGFSEFDYFWIACFAPLLFILTILTNIPFTLLFIVFQ